MLSELFGSIVCKEEQLIRYSPLSSQSILALLAIRHPLDDRIFLFALSDASELSKDLYPALCAHNPIKEADYKTVIPGLVEIEDLSSLLAFNPDWIAITGDYLGIQRALAQFQIHERIVPDALAKNKVLQFHIMENRLLCDALASSSFGVKLQKLPLE